MEKNMLKEIESYCNKLLRIHEFADWTEAQNGLQLENSGQVNKIVAAVDVSCRTVRMAVERKASLMMVHHGLFWGGIRPWVGKRYELIRDLIKHDIALFSCHLPLDAHPTLGNNAQLAQVLGLSQIEPFMEMKGQFIGYKGVLKIRREELKSLFEKVLGSSCVVLGCGPEQCEKIGIVSGGAGEEVTDAFYEGVDTYITGEGPHWTWTTAQELGINVLYGGHYMTERFGIRALATHVAEHFNIPWEFMDDPSGL